MPDLPATHHSGPVGSDAMMIGLVSGPQAGTKCRLLHKCWLRTVASAATSGNIRCADDVVHDDDHDDDHDGDHDDDHDDDHDYDHDDDQGDDFQPTSDRHL